MCAIGCQKRIGLSETGVTVNIPCGAWKLNLRFIWTKKSWSLWVNGTYSLSPILIMIKENNKGEFVLVFNLSHCNWVRGNL